MLKKRLGINAIERDWLLSKIINIETYFKIPSSLIISRSCEIIGDRVFQGCDGLKKVVIPESVKKIGNGAFEWSGKLRKVEIPKSVEWIGNLAFAYCDNATIILQKPKRKFKFIGNCAFYCIKNVEEKTRTRMYGEKLG